VTDEPSKGHRRGNYEMISKKCSCRILVVVLMLPAMWVLASRKTIRSITRADVDSGAVVGLQNTGGFIFESVLVLGQCK
jgi:hypothetical protein